MTSIILPLFAALATPFGLHWILEQIFRNVKSVGKIEPLNKPDFSNGLQNPMK